MGPLAQRVGAAALLVLACLVVSPPAGAPPPTSSDRTVTTNEDTAHVFATSEFEFSDTDPGTALTSVKIASLPDSGTLTNDGSAVTVDQAIPTADIAAGRLIFTPDPNDHGDPYASFTFRVNDGTEDSTSDYTMTIDVTPANDPPTSMDRTVTTNEDTPYTFTAGDFDFADVDTGDTLASVTIVIGPQPGGRAGTLTIGGSAVTVDQAILTADIEAGRLVFTPDPNDHGDPYATFAFRVNDGTEDSTSDYTMTIDVTPANDPPTSRDNTVTTNEDTAYTFMAGDFAFADVDGVGDMGDTLESVTIVITPILGELRNQGEEVMEGLVIAFDDIEANSLVFTPEANGNGNAYASFTFRVNDGTDDSVSTYIMTIDVNPTNDAPTASNTKVSTQEDEKYTFTPGDFGFDDIDRTGGAGDTLAAVTIVTLPERGELTYDGTKVLKNEVIPTAGIDADELEFIPESNAYGTPYASFTFRVNDGTADSESTYTMTIDVNSVNDAPTGNDRVVTTLEDTSYRFGLRDFAFSDTEEDDRLSSVRIVTLPELGVLTNGGTGVSADQAVARADIEAGKLVFAPLTDDHGQPYTSFTFRVSDGNRDSKQNYTMTINVIATVETATLRAWNARLGRTIGGQLIDAVTARFEFGGGSQASLGGRRIGGSGPGGRPGLSGSADRQEWMKDARGRAGLRASRQVTDEDLLRDSAFHLSGGEAREGGAYAVWGHLATGGFETRAGGDRLDGEVSTRLLGVDGEWGRVLAGVAIARSEAKGSFRETVSPDDGSNEGTIESGLTGVYPYARLAFGEGLAAWGLVGYGGGELTLSSDDVEHFETSLAMQVGALGVKGRILDGKGVGGLRVSVKSDAMWVSTASDGARGLNEAGDDARRLRLLVDADRSFEVGGVATLIPSGEIGLRHDSGNADRGAGLELGGGVRYALGTFTAEGRGRVLVVHDAPGHKEWGASGSVAMSADAFGRGLSYSFQPVWGRAESGTEALWSLDGAWDRGTRRSFEPEARLDAQLGYGFGVLGDRFTATPELRLKLAGSHRQYTVGWRLEHARRERGELGLQLEATRHRSDDRQPEYGLAVRGTIRW